MNKCKMVISVCCAVCVCMCVCACVCVQLCVCACVRVCVCVCRSNHECFFTSDSTMKKERFMAQLNFPTSLED